MRLRFEGRLIWFSSFSDEAMLKSRSHFQRQVGNNALHDAMDVVQLERPLFETTNYWVSSASVKADGGGLTGVSGVALSTVAVGKEKGARPDTNDQPVAPANFPQICRPDWSKAFERMFHLLR